MSLFRGFVPLALSLGLVHSTFVHADTEKAAESSPKSSKAEPKTIAGFENYSPAVKDTKLGTPADHATPEAIDKDYADFTAVYRDYAGLFTADDFRVPAEAKLVKKLDLDNADNVAKFAALKKKIDRIEKKFRLKQLLNSVRASETQFPRVYRIAKKVAAILELRGNFNIFISQSPEFNAYTYSYDMNDFDVVIHSSLVEELTDEALAAVIGHEMGHVKDQAVLLRVIATQDFEARHKDTSAASHSEMYNRVFNEMPPNVRDVFAQVALESVASGTVLGALTDDEQSELARNCELTADRAAVIATGGEAAALRLMSALTYGSKTLTPDFNQEELMKQITDVLSSLTDPTDISDVLEEQSGHPFHVVRLLQIRDYANSKSYGELKTKLASSSFAKELDSFIRIVAQGVDKSNKLKKYLEDKGESDDTLVRLRTQKTYRDDLTKLTAALGTLGNLVLLQLDGSDLSKPENEVFAVFVAKATKDSDGTLKLLLIPGIQEIIQKKLASGVTEAAKAELEKKAKTLKELKEVE
jgi:Zn-dependent protease with chaperone function